jgi:hypothetical protein
VADYARLLALALVLLAPSAALADEEAAKKAEDEAFTAVEEERWCDAMHGFLVANDAAPSIDLIFNAALAADEAQDRKRALKLYVELLGAYPDSDRGESVNTRIADLTKAVQKDGDGTPCPEPEATEEPAAEPAPAEQAPPPAEEPPPPAGVTYILPWSVAGAGAVIAVAGVGLAVLGGVPYFDFIGAREQILAAEREGGDAAALQERQEAARGAWTTWGELTMWAGVTTSVVGLGVATGGVVWGLVGGGEE